MIKKIIPSTLIGRSIIIIFVPIIIIVLLTSFVFYQTSWSIISKRLTESVAADINVLVKLINKRNDIVLREELADQEFDETELRKVDVQVTRLRQKIETNAKQPQFIKTIRGKGYKLICNEI